MNYMQTTPEPPDPWTFLGMSRATLIATIVTAILVPFILTILGAWLSKKWRDRLRVRVLSNLKHKQFEQLSALYLERVPDYERVPPNHFRAFFRREYSAASVRDFRRRVKKNTVPVHLLLVASTSEGVCGFLKAIFVPEVRCLFIAYLVTTRGSTHEERTVTQNLISCLFNACDRSGVSSIVFEICIGAKSSHKAKARLFRHYASMYGLHLRRIDAKYQQPEICSFDAGDCKLTNAELHVAHLENKAKSTIQTIGRDEYKGLVAAIYQNVYLKSYVLAEPQLTREYKEFLFRVTTSLFAGIRSKTIDLK